MILFMKWQSRKQYNKVVSKVKKEIRQAVIQVLIGKILPLIVENISDELRDFIVTEVEGLEIRAQQTDNKFDDILVTILKLIIGID